MSTSPQLPPANRRQFLKKSLLTATALVSAPVFAPPGILGQNAPNSRIGVAFLGLGRQAYHANLLPFLASPETQVVALCDVDQWRLQQGLQRVENHYSVNRPTGYRGCLTTGDFRDVLARSDVDAVMISSPDHWHAVMAVAAAKAGKHVALEKPISLSIRQGRAIADAVQANRCVFRTDTEVRSSKDFRQLRQIVRTGRIGQVQTVIAGVPEEQAPVPVQAPTPVPDELDYPMWLGPAPQAPYTEKRVHTPKNHGARPGWMLIRDYCDGMICNWGTHLLDIVQWTLGTERTGPIQVEGKGTFHPASGLSGVLSAFEVDYAYADGIRLHYRMAGRPFIRFEGTAGWVEAEWWKGVSASDPDITQAPLEPDGFTSRQVNEKLDFIDGIAKGRPTLIPAETGHRTNSLCQLGLIAIETGERLQWDPAQERFGDSEAANRRLERPLREPWSVG
ncbi:MAG: Gfo/Idh/MocA family oxidoreductase [Verrucomicrobiae bacterium]|nr:Gfo/Idh/MocA family oxidoreductase [Verrucomicrobiae bacterium]